MSVRIGLGLAALILLLSSLAWLSPLPVRGAHPSATPVIRHTLTPTSTPAPTRTPFPLDYAQNGQQTIGITIAGSILVLIVVVGVIVFMPKHPVN